MDGIDRDRVRARRANVFDCVGVRHDLRTHALQHAGHVCLRRCRQRRQYVPVADRGGSADTGRVAHVVGATHVESVRVRRVCVLRWDCFRYAEGHGRPVSYRGTAAIGCFKASQQTARGVTDGADRHRVGAGRTGVRDRVGVGHGLASHAALRNARHVCRSGRRQRRQYIPVADRGPSAGVGRVALVVGATHVETVRVRRVCVLRWDCFRYAEGHGRPVSYRGTAAIGCFKASQQTARGVTDGADRHRVGAGRTGVRDRVGVGHGLAAHAALQNARHVRCRRCRQRRGPQRGRCCR